MCHRPWQIRLAVACATKHGNLVPHFRAGIFSQAVFTWLQKGTMSLTPSVKGILQKPFSKGMLGRWKGVLDLLLSSKPAFKSKLPVSTFLIHRQNRGGSSVQPFHMHRKDAKIAQCGASLDLLICSVCFEMQPEESKKPKQVQFNQDLVGASSGFMVPVQSGEGYLIISPSHTSQSCRAVGHGG